MREIKAAVILIFYMFFFFSQVHADIGGKNYRIIQFKIFLKSLCITGETK